jgi:poly-beta-1,6-N-acetyl-D-glucosamine synthase
MPQSIVFPHLLPAINHLLVRLILNTLNGLTDVATMVYVLAVILVIHIFFLFWLYAGLSHRPTQSASSGSAVSVIIVFRNERESLPACLKAIAGQDYSLPMQVILADDGSSDGSTNIADHFIRDRIGWSLLRRERSPGWASTKKELLEMAVTQAQHELLLFTDADCVPPSSWVSTMERSFAADTVLVAGFSPQQSLRSPFWNEILLLDSLSAALVAVGTIGRQIGVTCTGRNLAFRKSSWQASGGYATLPDTLSGDDDFMLRALSRHGNIRYCLSADSVVPAKGPNNLSEFLFQKQRHLSSGRHYSLSAQLGYGFFHFNHSLLWLSLAAAFFMHPLCSLFFAGGLFIDFIILTCLARKFQQHFSLPGFLAWQILFLYYNLSAAVRRHQPPRSWQEPVRA